MTFHGTRIRFDLASWGWRLVAVLLFVFLPVCVLVVHREMDGSWWEQTKGFAFECLELVITGDQEA